MSVLNKSPFRYDTVKKCVSVFGAIFNGMVIERIDNDGVVKQVVEVPVSYSNREKWLARLQEQPDLNSNKTAIVLPRIGFELVAIQYDGSRHVQSLNKVRTSIEDANGFTYVYAPVPYNLSFRMYIATKTLSDGLNLLEQIVPFFTPTYTPTIEILPGVFRDCPINIAGTDFSDSYDGAFDQKREIIFTLDFVMKTYLFGPSEKSETILKTQMTLDPTYGTIARRVTSTATEQPDGSFVIQDERFDVDRDPIVY